MAATTYTTPFTGWHRQAGAKMTDFAGWEMPLSYSSLIEEHEAVRTSVGLFDLSHMAEIEIRGGESLPFLQEMLTNDVSRLEVGQALYSCLCDLDGGIIDDLLLYRFEKRYWIVANASNRAAVWSWLSEHALGREVELLDRTEEIALIAVQGPKSEAALAPHLAIEPSELDFYRFLETEVCGRPVVLSRTGYTGEDGFELYLRNEDAMLVWEALLKGSEPVQPIGLGARDTLRLESGFALYGHELARERTPYDVSLAWVTKLDTEPAPLAASALAAAKDRATTCLVGLEMEGRAVPRAGYEVLWEGRTVGTVTSGTFSPTLKKGVALAIVERAVRAAGTDLEVSVRGRPCPARVVKLPFVRGSVKRHS